MVPQIWRVTRGNQGSGGSLQFRQGSSAWILRCWWSQVSGDQIAVSGVPCRGQMGKHRRLVTTLCLRARVTPTRENWFLLKPMNYVVIRHVGRSFLFLRTLTITLTLQGGDTNACPQNLVSRLSHSHTSLTMLTCLTEEPMNYVVRITC